MPLGMDRGDQDRRENAKNGGWPSPPVVTTVPKRPTFMQNL
jgi:hypothetical protein